jgi:hypothetical protein
VDTVIALRDHMQASPHSKRVRMKCLIALIQAEIDRRTGYPWENRKRVEGVIPPFTALILGLPRASWRHSRGKFEMWLQSQTEAFQLRVYLSFYVFYAWRLAVPLSRAERGERAPR